MATSYKRITLSDYKPGRWYCAETIDDTQAFYLSRLTVIRDAAHEHGYTIGLHGSARRDFDLMAMPWRDDHSSKDDLARAVHHAACEITNGRYEWEQKPAGRWATCFPICWPELQGMVSAGHIDLSVVVLSGC
jgi:hypothetical protein